MYSVTNRLRYGAYYCWLARASRDPILVYQMGKVGSTSIARSLRVATNLPVLQLHWLSDAGFGRWVERTAGSGRKGPHYWGSVYFRKWLRRQARYWRIISPVREPVARNVSAFFQALDIWYPEYSENRRLPIAQLAKHVMSAFLDRYPHWIPLEWFDLELNEVFGINVFERPFNTELGYQIISTDSAAALILRLEDLDDILVPACREFFGVTVSCERRNEARRGPHAPVYQFIRKNRLLPSDYVTAMYESSYARHFYSQAELESLALKWSRFE